jgi:membrane-associated protein
MEYIHHLIDLFLHLDKHLDALVSAYGSITYLVLFLIVFCETGLVVMPLLPGDSLLFAVGALCSRGLLDMPLIMVLLIIAAVLGDAVNYFIGSYLGPRAFKNPNSRIFKKAYLERTQSFYERYGGKTIILARFVPIVRTFAPFLAGVGAMKYSQFFAYNVIGALLWVILGIYAGYLFGAIPIVKNNFSLVVLGIVIVSLLPAVFEYLRARQSKLA